MDFSLDGHTELMALLSQLDKKTGNKIIRKISRKHLKTVVDEVKKDFPVDRGVTKKSIKIYAGKKAREAITLAVQSKDKNYIEKFLDYGVKNKDGTWRIEPRMYFQKAYDKVGETVKQNIIDEVTAEINRLVNLQDNEG